MMNMNPMEIFQQEAPPVANAFIILNLPKILYSRVTNSLVLLMEILSSQG